MCPGRIVDYLKSVFKDDTSVKMTVIDDLDAIQKAYPLAHAVTRASLKGDLSIYPHAAMTSALSWACDEPYSFPY